MEPFDSKHSSVIAPTLVSPDSQQACLFAIGVLLPQGFKHLVDAAFLLLHVGVNIEIEGCGDIGVS